MMATPPTYPPSSIQGNRAMVGRSDNDTIICLIRPKHSDFHAPNFRGV